VRLHVQEHDIDPNSPVVYMALSLLCYSQNGLVPELMYLPSPKQIVDFIKVFGEETVRTPTRDEFSRDLVAALAAHHTMVERQSFLRAHGTKEAGILTRSNWAPAAAAPRGFDVKCGVARLQAIRRLDRYERRANSRRKRALSELSQLCQVPTFR
jgi:hypothetical protein